MEGRQSGESQRERDNITRWLPKAWLSLIRRWMLLTSICAGHSTPPFPPKAAEAPRGVLLLRNLICLSRPVTHPGHAARVLGAFTELLRQTRSFPAPRSAHRHAGARSTTDALRPGSPVSIDLPQSGLSSSHSHSPLLRPQPPGLSQAVPDLRKTSRSSVVADQSEYMRRPLSVCIKTWLQSLIGFEKRE